MNIFRTLSLGESTDSKKIYFGQITESSELNEVFSLRYQVYSKKAYISESRFPNGLEMDNYDEENKCRYFVAKFEDRIIGCIRLITDNPLPTQIDFSFSEPSEIASIPVSRRCELGRFIIIPPNKEKKEFFPRGLVMLFLTDSLIHFANVNGFLGGYSFVKKSLEIKMKRLKMPFKKIEHFMERYPKDGVLSKYFSQPNDPVIPIYFITKDFSVFCSKHIRESLMFGRINEYEYILKENLYVSFLKKLKII